MLPHEIESITVGTIVFNGVSRWRIVEFEEFNTYNRDSANYFCVRTVVDIVGFSNDSTYWMEKHSMTDVSYTIVTLGCKIKTRRGW